MKVQIHCPFCEETYELDEFPEGAYTKCEKCGQEFVIDMRVIGPGTKQSPPVLQQPPKVVPIPPPLTPKAVPQGIPQAFDAPQKKFTPPILAKFFQIASVLSVLGAIIVFSAIGKYGSDFSSFLLLGGLLVNAIIMWGCAEIITHISEIRYHAIRQTKLLEMIALYTGRK